MSDVLYAFVCGLAENRREMIPQCLHAQLNSVFWPRAAFRE